MGTVLSYNKVILAGRLVAEPELRQSVTGDYVCLANLAVSRPYQKGKEQTSDFFELVAWGSNGEFLSKYFHKGSPIVIEGEVRNKRWTANDGTKKQKTEIKVSTIKFVESSRKGENTTDAFSSDSEPNFETVAEDELPF